MRGRRREGGRAEAWEGLKEGWKDKEKVMESVPARCRFVGAFLFTSFLPPSLPLFSFSMTRKAASM